MTSPRPFRACVAALALALLAGGARADDIDSARRLNAAGRGSEALASVDRQLASQPKDPSLRFLRGVLLSDAKRDGEAVEVFERLTQDYPELPEPHNNLAVLYAARGDFERARLALGSALRANPRYAIAEANLGDVLLQLALQSFQRAQSLDPQDASLAPKLAMLRQLTHSGSRATP